MILSKTVENLVHAGPIFRDALASRSPSVLASLLGPAFRGLVQQKAKGSACTEMRLDYKASFAWRYQREFEFV